ncbi:MULTISPECIES: MMPL family transporter [unclassified Leucobacter]|uniref:MMPL family transporter n=1 Tax=unclassified Leucobacter TaxID=2621730 RepID=UPI00165E0573|nr:MMPL family transporter [Leucobacter sp. cx-87]
MSSVLYSLGRWAAKARSLVLIGWIVILAIFGAGAVFLGQGANAPISIPGTESQAALDQLSRTFPEVSGGSAQVIVVSPEGTRIDSSPYPDEIARTADELADLDGVAAVQSPFGGTAGASSDSALSEDGRAALISITLDGTSVDAPPATLEGISAAVADLQDRLPEGAQAVEGGEAYSTSIPGITITEAVGVLVAFVVLVLTLGSLLAAGMPLLAAILGVGVSIAGLFFATAVVSITSITPMLALMLGLAVGIDYTLFIVARHQEQIRDGMPIEESIARATATSGSAVIFAGLTVIIALAGLAVAGIPFLTALGLAAAAAVAISVLIALTLTPAILGMAGIKILPKRQRAALAAGTLASAANAPAAAPVTGAHGAGSGPITEPSNAAAGAPAAPRKPFADRFFGGWVAAVTKIPALTIILVLLGVGAMAVPALDLRLALPNASSLSEDAPARISYELVGEHFGEGVNGPLLLTGSIVASNDPLGLMADLADEVRQVPGVAEVPLSTPNQGADTGIIQVVPEEGPHAESTSQLVDALRAKAPEWSEQYGVDLAVTGFTAVGIDVSKLLGEALLPFGILVVGFSLILLAMVFRSVWVPIKATLGYLLSVGAAFGAVAAVFEWGWFSEALHVASLGPVLSFMPIILMGVLFGLAMDYEVFLVARIREEYVHGASARDAIRRGFVGSGKVVTAAAIIMFAVFAAFIPEGDVSIKPIALGLAVGVFVDAFIVRMTLVPAVLALLGDRAWQMPRWLDKILPSFDVEGEGLSRELAHAHWPEDLPEARIASEGLELVAADGTHRIADVRVGPGDALLLSPQDPAHRRLAEVLTGRAPMLAGTAKVAGLLLPERASTLRRRAARTQLAGLREALADRPQLLVLDLAQLVPASEAAILSARSALEGRAVEAERGAAPMPTLVLLSDADTAARILPAGTHIVHAETRPLTAPDFAESSLPAATTLTEGAAR